VNEAQEREKKTERGHLVEVREALGRLTEIEQQPAKRKDRKAAKAANKITGKSDKGASKATRKATRMPQKEQELQRGQGARAWTQEAKAERRAEGQVFLDMSEGEKKLVMERQVRMLRCYCSVRMVLFW
jgi:hypothetical protein